MSDLILYTTEDGRSQIKLPGQGPYRLADPAGDVPAF